MDIPYDTQAEAEAREDALAEGIEPAEQPTEEVAILYLEDEEA